LDGRADWTRLDGAFRRFPIGVRKIGCIGGTGDGIFIEDVARDHDWIAHPDWVRRERISSFGGQPLVFNGEILGVLGVQPRSKTLVRSPALRLPTTRRSRCACAGAETDEQPKEQLSLKRLPARGRSSDAPTASSATVRRFNIGRWQSLRRRLRPC
jgi:hypothetical protein